MYSKNIYKSGWVLVQNEDKCVIDSNSRIAQRLEELEAIQRRSSSDDESYSEGFMGGLGAEKIDALQYDGEDEGGNVIKAVQNNEPEGPTLEEIRAQIDAELEEAQTQVEEMKRMAMEEIEAQRRELLDEARRNGYDEGMRMAKNEEAKMKRELELQRDRLAKEYDQLIDELEPRFIDTITAIYKHIFNIELADEKKILLYLIDSTLRKVDSSRAFIVHVSKEDYAYVSSQKQALTENAVSGRGTVEVVEDITLRQNECMIETDGGIFDCGVGTQLEALTKKLKILAYNNEE